MNPSAKYAPTVLLPWAGALPFDWAFVPFVLVAMIAAWMARAGQRVAAREAWPEIRRDLIVSLLIGGGNAILAAAIIVQFDLGYPAAMAVAFFLALGGVETIKIGWGTATRVWGWLIDRWFEGEGARRQQQAKIDAAEAILRARELDELARKLDGEKGDE